MNQQERISSEFAQIEQTDFWRLFVRTIMDKRKVLSRECETKDDVRESQGGIKVIDWILGVNEQKPLQERILLALRDQTKKENK